MVTRICIGITNKTKCQIYRYPDPNGEYARALGPTTKFKGRVFKVEAEGSENQLQVPSWFWNSSEWASFTQVSPKAQLPLLKRSLRAMRNQEFDLQKNRTQ